MNNCIGTWIINKNYLVPGYVSIASFRKQTDIPIVIYHDESLTEEIKQVFTSMGPNISFRAPKQKKKNNNSFSEHIHNRLIRMEIVEEYSNQSVLLIDADTAFSTGTQKMIQSIADTQQLDANKPLIWGVIEYEHAADAWLYFKKTHISGTVDKTPLSKKQEVFAEIFGSNWKELTQFPQFNNGLLAFYNCKKLAAAWKGLYCKGLENEYINPLDDQVPLAVAIATLTHETVLWPLKYNSLGKSSGDFSMYHVWAGNWKKELLMVEAASPYLSDYGKIAKEFWKDIPREWISLFVQDCVSTAASL